MNNRVQQKLQSSNNNIKMQQVSIIFHCHKRLYISHLTIHTTSNIFQTRTYRGFEFNKSYAYYRLLLLKNVPLHHYYNSSPRLTD